MPHYLDHNTYTYIAVTLSQDSPYHAEPSGLAERHHLSYIGPVGELLDTQLVAVPRAQWHAEETDILGWLKSRSGVLDVQVQAAPKSRTKRSGEDL
jgi:hypothetical protein